ncbi:MAG: exopolysaccharide biosynthesis protein [Chitinophagaceae bacterium]|nr:exopolysaccharide biosynthesis protein [Rubrivivax sp.]
MSPGAPSGQPGTADEVHPGSLSQLLTEIAADTRRERVSVADLLLALQDRALAALLLIFALPNVIPVPPGTSALLGAPLLFLAAQLAFGMRPWLPGFISRRSMPRHHFAALITRAAPWLERAERLLRPRWSALCRPPAEYGVGLVCLLLSVIIFLPIPLGNMLPALAICLMALGILERDGLWVLAGLFTAIASVALVWGVLYALIKGAAFVFTSMF